MNYCFDTFVSYSSRHQKEKDDLERKQEKEMQSFRKKVEARKLKAQQRKGKPAVDAENTDIKLNGYGSGSESLPNPQVQQLSKQCMKKKISQTGMIEQLEKFTIESKSKKKPAGATTGQPIPPRLETKLSLNQIKEKQAGTAVTSSTPTQIYSGSSIFAPVQDPIQFARTTSATNLTQMTQQQPQVTVAPGVIPTNMQWAPPGVGRGDQPGWIPTTTTACNGQYVPVMPIQQARAGNIPSQPLRQPQHQQLPHR